MFSGTASAAKLTSGTRSLHAASALFRTSARNQAPGEIPSLYHQTSTRHRKANKQLNVTQSAYLGTMPKATPKKIMKPTNKLKSKMEIQPERNITDIRVERARVILDDSGEVTQREDAGEEGAKKLSVQRMVPASGREYTQSFNDKAPAGRL